MYTRAPTASKKLLQKKKPTKKPSGTTRSPASRALFTLPLAPRRLYTGFAGNLQEKVPLLLGFVALSFFIVLPVYAYFWFGQEAVQPFDKALNTVAISLLAAEVLAVRLFLGPRGKGIDDEGEGAMFFWWGGGKGGRAARREGKRRAWEGDDIGV